MRLCTENVDSKLHKHRRSAERSTQQKTSHCLVSKYFWLVSSIIKLFLKLNQIDSYLRIISTNYFYFKMLIKLICTPFCYECWITLRCLWSTCIKTQSAMYKTEKTYSRVYVYIFNPESVAQHTQHCANAGNCVLRYEITFRRPRLPQHSSACL